MRGAAIALAAVVVLAGCGAETSARTTATSDATASAQPSPEPSAGKAEESSDGKDKDKGTPKASPSVPADAPACAAVWRDGLRLARDYKGCMAGKQFVTVDQEPCSFGQQLVRFGDHFYAVRGGPVNRTAAPLTKDRTYRGAVASCRA